MRVRVCVYIYIFVYTHIKAYLLIIISLSPYHQFLSFRSYLKLCIGRIRTSFHIVIVQKVKNILKVVFVVIK